MRNFGSRPALAPSIPLAILLSLSLAAAAPGAPTLVSMDVLPGDVHSQGYAVSADGTVVTGFSAPTEGERAIRWTRVGGLQDLGPPVVGYPTYNRGHSCSEDGAVIVGTNGDCAFRWTAESGLVALDRGPGSVAYASSVSADGAVIGGHWAGADSHPCLWTAKGGFEDLGLALGWDYATLSALNADGSVATGTGGIPGTRYRAYCWTRSDGFQELGVLTGAAHSIGMAINADGSVIVGGSGSLLAGPGNSRAFRWTAVGGMQDLDMLPGTGESVPYCVSGDGLVVGGDSAYRAFIWTQGLGMVELQTHLQSWGVDLTGWTLHRVQGLSFDGATMTGIGTLNGVERGWVATGVSFAPPPPCADVSGDGVVNFIDISSILTYWGTGSPFGDANDDGLVDFDDITAVLAQWLNECP